MHRRPAALAVPTAARTASRPLLCSPLALAACLASVAACGPEKADRETDDDSSASSGNDSSASSGNPSPSDAPTGSTGEPDDTATGSTGEPAPAECACIIDEQGEQGTPAQPTCGESLCDIVDAETAGIDLDSLVVSNPEALDCVLKALRDRTPGIVRWSWTENGGQWTDDGYVLINADGTAVHRSWGAADVVFAVGDAKFGALPEPAVFEQCLTGGGTDRERFKCATDFDLRAPTLVCDEGWGESLL